MTTRFPVPAAALAVAALLSAPAAAAGFDFANQPNDTPIEVTAEQGLEWSQDGQRITARGAARAVRGNVTVLGDTLIAFYRQVNGQTEISRLEAHGNVTIKTPTENATGTLAVYDVPAATMTLKGGPAKIVTATDTITAKNDIQYNETTKVAVARGDALAIRADKRIRADVLTARFAEDKDGKMALNKANADGGVVVTSPTEVATGDKGDYDAKTGIVTLTGSVKITRGDNQLNGGYAQFNMNTGVSNIMAGPPGTKSKGRVEGLFTPDKSGEGGLPIGKSKGRGQ